MPSKNRRCKLWTEADVAVLREMYGKSPKYLVNGVPSRPDMA